MPISSFFSVQGYFHLSISYLQMQYKGNNLNETLKAAPSLGRLIARIMPVFLHFCVQVL
jgi:hypothetical protein